MENNDQNQTTDDYDMSFFEFRICVIGMDKAGQNLAHLFSAKYTTVGFDEDNDKVRLLSKKLKKGNLSFTSNPEAIRDCNFYILSEIEYPSLIKNGEVLGNVISKGDFVVLDKDFKEGEEPELISVLENVSGLKYDEDFFGARTDMLPNLSVKDDNDDDNNNDEVTKIVNALFSSVYTKKIG